MTAPFRLYGAELSPYSVKVRSYLRYKGLDFEWRARTNATQEEFQRYAKLPLIPVLATTPTRTIWRAPWLRSSRAGTSLVTVPGGWSSVRARSGAGRFSAMRDPPRCSR